MITETRIDVRYPDCDMMGIVHHAVYPVWYEAARMDFFSQMGFSFSEMHARGINPPLVNLELHYKSPVRYPGTVTVRTRMTFCAPKKLELSYEVWPENSDTPAARAVSFHIWTGPDMKSLDLEQNLPEIYARILAASDRSQPNIPERGRHARTPLLTFVGKSGTGKTTFLEQLVPELKRRGLRVAMVKHDAHQFEMDRPGKDTWRFAQAGADAVIISNAAQAALIEHPPRELTLDEVISRLPPADLILTEGYKSEHNPKMELHRKSLNRPLLTPPEELVALITDEPMPVSVPQLALDDISGCADLILQWMNQPNVK